MRTLAGDYGLARCCRVLGVPRSTAAYRSRRRPASEDPEPLKILIRTLLVTLRGYGVRRMHEHLRQTKVACTRSQVRRAYAEMGLLKKPPKKRRVRTTNSRHGEAVYPNLVQHLKVSRPDQVWASDVTFVRLKRRFAHLALVMDLFTREILGWSLSLANDTALTLSALQAAKKQGRAPEIHHSDRGHNYAAKRYVLELGATRISMAEAGRPQDNGHVERLNRTLKEEEIYWSEYRDLEEATASIGAYIEHYNRTRIHSALGYKRPNQVFKEWAELQTEAPLK